VSEWTSIKALVAWKTQGIDNIDQIELSSKTATIKVRKSFYNMICDSDTLRVPTPDGQYIECKKTTDPTGFGIGSQAFVVFFVRAAN
jgi:hypothetical protein